MAGDRLRPGDGRLLLLLLLLFLLLVSRRGGRRLVFSNFCCGKFKPEHPDMQSDFGDLHRPAAGEEPVTVQPGAPVVLEMPAPERAPPAQTVSQV